MGNHHVSSEKRGKSTSSMAILKAKLLVNTTDSLSGSWLGFQGWAARQVPAAPGSASRATSSAVPMSSRNFSAKFLLPVTQQVTYGGRDFGVETWRLKKCVYEHHLWKLMKVVCQSTWTKYGEKTSDNVWVELSIYSISKLNMNMADQQFRINKTNVQSEEQWIDSKQAVFGFDLTTFDNHLQRFMVLSSQI